MAEPSPHFNVSLDRDMEALLHDPENGRMQHWSQLSEAPARVAHINELTNEELSKNVRGTFWVMIKASDDEPQYGFTPFGHATRMEDGVLTIRIM